MRNKEEESPSNPLLHQDRIPLMDDGDSVGQC